VKVVPTTGPETAASIARECIKNGADLILAGGGDGTINEVLNGMVHSTVPLAILPAGTANVLACEMGMRTRMTTAAEVLAEAVPTQISLGLLQPASGPERYFTLMAGVGLDALIVYRINAALKARIGKAAYWIAGFGHVGRPLPEFDVIASGRQIRCSFALASRVRNYGGDLWIARNASLFDDTFELVLFEGSNSLPYLKYLGGVFTNRLGNMKGVTVLKTREVEFRAAEDPQVYMQIDGEYVGRPPARISIVPRSLTLLVPPKFRIQPNG
jgi:YegS/Rv2252/BmrU family lipid kinase